LSTSQNGGYAEIAKCDGTPGQTFTYVPSTHQIQTGIGGMCPQSVEQESRQCSAD